MSWQIAQTDLNTGYVLHQLYHRSKCQIVHLYIHLSFLVNERTIWLAYGNQVLLRPEVGYWQCNQIKMRDSKSKWKRTKGVTPQRKKGTIYPSLCWNTVLDVGSLHFHDLWNCASFRGKILLANWRSLISPNCAIKTDPSRSYVIWFVLVAVSKIRLLISQLCIKKQAEWE